MDAEEIQRQRLREGIKNSCAAVNGRFTEEELSLTCSIKTDHVKTDIVVGLDSLTCDIHYIPKCLEVVGKAYIKIKNCNDITHKKDYEERDVITIGSKTAQANLFKDENTVTVDTE